MFEECFTFVKQQRINCLLFVLHFPFSFPLPSFLLADSPALFLSSSFSEGSWFMHGTSIKTYAREPSRNIPRGWTFIRLVRSASLSSRSSFLLFLQTDPLIPATTDIRLPTESRLDTSRLSINTPRSRRWRISTNEVSRSLS